MNRAAALLALALVACGAPAEDRDARFVDLTICSAYYSILAEAPGIAPEIVAHHRRRSRDATRVAVQLDSATFLQGFQASVDEMAVEMGGSWSRLPVLTAKYGPRCTILTNMTTPRRIP